MITITFPLPSGEKELRVSMPFLLSWASTQHGAIVSEPGGKMYSFYRFIPSAGICLSGFPCTNTKKALIHADWVGLMPWDVTADG